MRIFENPVIPFNFEVYQQGKHMAYFASGARIHAIGLVNLKEGNFILVQSNNGSMIHEALFTLEGVCINGRFENIVLEEICCEGV